MPSDISALPEKIAVSTKRRVFGAINATLLDPLLAFIIAVPAMDMYTTQPADTGDRVGMLALTSCFIVAKNYFDYYRARKNVEQNGWTKDVFYEPYLRQLGNYAWTERQEKIYYYYKEQYENEVKELQQHIW